MNGRQIAAAKINSFVDYTLQYMTNLFWILSLSLFHFFVPSYCWPRAFINRDMNFLSRCQVYSVQVYIRKIMNKKVHKMFNFIKKGVSVGERDRKIKV